MHTNEDTLEKPFRTQVDVMMILREAFRFFSARFVAYRIAGRMERDLERLADTSPHLLADVGVTDDCREGGEGAVGRRSGCWSGGTWQIFRGFRWW